MRSKSRLVVACLALTVAGLCGTAPLAAQDLVVDGTTVVIDTDTQVDGSVYVQNGGELIIREATLTLILDYDEEHSVDVADSSRLVIDDAIVRSEGGQFWFELYGDGENSPTMEVSGENTWLTNHSGIRPFDRTRITVAGGDVEELQVRDQVQVELVNAAAYPVFFFAGTTAQLSGLHTDTEYTINNDIDFRASGGWRFSMTNAWIEGYQIDLEPGSDVSLSDSDGIVLSIHTPGDLGPELQVVEGLTADQRIPYGLTENLGSRFEFTDCNIALINVYVFGDDRVLLRDMHINEVNAEQGSELLIGGEGTNTVLNCNLCQVYDHATFTVDRAIIDASENIPSATASFADFDPVGRGVMTFLEMDLDELYLTLIEQGVIRIHNSTYDPGKLSVIDATASFEEYTLSVDFSASPLSGTAPLEVQFTDLSTGDVVSHSWNFGDGSASSEQSPAHTYAAEGTYSVSLTVTGTAGSNSASRSDYITVTGGSVTTCDGEPVYVAAAAHAPGDLGSVWRTDLAVFNAGEPHTDLSLKYLAADTDNGGAACVAAGSVGGWASVMLEDVLLDVFAVDSGTGGIAVYSGNPDMIVSSRTYNVSDEGTFGQTIPGRSAAEAISDGDTGVLVQLHQNDDYRTNVGFLNASGEAADVTVELYAEDGTYLGSHEVALQPYEQHQVNRIFTRLTAQAVSNGRAEVIVSGGPVLAYASVVDNGTSDPSYIEPQ